MQNGLSETHPFTDEDRANLAALEARRDGFPGDQRRLVPLLKLAQDTIGYLPEQALSLVAKHLALSLSEVYGVASFYNQFRFTPPGRHRIKACMGTACHVKGGDIILENFERKLEIREGETTADRTFSIEPVAWVGCCALAPVALVGEAVHSRMAPSKVERLVLQMQMDEEKSGRRNSLRHFSTNNSIPLVALMLLFMNILLMQLKGYDGGKWCQAPGNTYASSR